MSQSMTEDKNRVLIIERIKGIEEEKNVTVLYACESGSRAWGFPSKDSDYDVRFLYIHRREWYLSIDDRRDVIEKPLDNQLDISGWDIKKALRLFRKSNPPLLEWLQSPIVYNEKHEFADKLRALLPEYYSPVSCLHHYLHMAKGNFREYLKGDTVWIKKYFYVLRPILACQWIEAGCGPVPVEFEKLVKQCIKSEDVCRVVNDLISRKLNGDELDRGPHIPALSKFIENELTVLEGKHFDKDLEKPDTEKLDKLFRDILDEACEFGGQYT